MPITNPVWEHSERHLDNLTFFKPRISTNVSANAFKIRVYWRPFAV